MTIQPIEREADAWQWSDFSGKWYTPDTARLSRAEQEEMARAMAKDHEGRVRPLYSADHIESLERERDALIASTGEHITVRSELRARINDLEAALAGEREANDRPDLRVVAEALERIHKARADADIAALGIAPSADDDLAEELWDDLLPVMQVPSRSADQFAVYNDKVKARELISAFAAAIRARGK